MTFDFTSIVFAIILLLQGQPVHSTATNACRECIKIRVGLPHVIRGPSPNLLDNRFTEIELPNGHFRGFSASGTTYAIDGDHPWSMGGALTPVLRPGAPGAIDSCGRWIQHVERVGSVLFGLVHNETDCKYQRGQTHKSMSFATSSDEGLTWKISGLILTGADRPTPGKNTGEGDCTAVDGKDGFWYAYCGRPAISATTVARAPLNNPGPGQWKNFFDGTWEQPGLGGSATPLKGQLTTSAARWNATGETIVLGYQPGGMGLLFSPDHVEFSAIREPILPLDRGIWKRPDPSEIVAYAVLLDAKDGSNQLWFSWNLVYTYVQPNETFADRYLVFRPIEVSRSAMPVHPQVGLLLARWYSAKLHDRWSTTAAVPGNYTSYQLDGKTGYLMTVADPGKASIELEDCVTESVRHSEHLLAEKGFCESHQYSRLRTAGWVYAQSQADTVPLYRCYSASEKTHFASNQPDCEKLGSSERLLGYALR